MYEKPFMTDPEERMFHFQFYDSNQQIWQLLEET
jgi:hypothetical protein